MKIYFLIWFIRYFPSYKTGFDGMQRFMLFLKINDFYLGQSTWSCWYICIFFNYFSYGKIQAFCTIYAVCCYSKLESLVIVCIQPIVYLMSGVVKMVSEKNLKWNKTRVFTQSCRGRWIFLLDLGLEKFLFMLKLCLCLLEIPQIALVIWAV